MIVCLPPFPPENLISREGFDRPVPHQPAIIDRRENEEINQSSWMMWTEDKICPILQVVPICANFVRRRGSTCISGIQSA